MSKTKRIISILGILLLALVGIGIGVGVRVLHRPGGEATGGGSESIGQSIGDLGQIVGNPRDGFPGKDRITILCMGLDDNWTDRGDEVYTAQARTDTLFLLTLDLDKQTATMLSIPRDTYCHIAGTHWNFKVNAAYETGGPQRAVATVNELLGVSADHYLVLNIDATKKMVDALGGVDVDVPHEMHYHDKWGHLSIDLMPGPQHLNGDQAVGFARYRHPDEGKKPTPEDGDERRMARQHILLKAMVTQAKTLANVTQAPHLVDVGMSAIRTDLTRTQLFDIAALYKGIQPDAIQTASLPGDDFRGPTGAWFYRLYPDKAKSYVNWLVRGDDAAARNLVPVVVQNGTALPGLAARVASQLKAFGYTDIHVDASVPRPAVHLTGTPVNATVPRTMLVDTGVAYADAPQDVATLLGLPSPLITRQPVQPNKIGWTPPAALTVTLGQDYASIVKSSGVLDTAPADTSRQN